MEGLTISFQLKVFSKADPQIRLQSSSEVFLLLIKVDVVFLQDPRNTLYGSIFISGYVSKLFLRGRHFLWLF